MLGKAIPFLAGLIVFAIWLQVRKDILTPRDVGIVLAQSCLPLLGITACASWLVRPATSVGRSLLRVLLVVVLSYPIWIAGWWIAYELVLASTNFGANIDLLNNSQVFLSSFVAGPGLPLAIAGLIAISSLVLRRHQQSQAKCQP